ncbi:multiple epidermal growth factor-like domains protein 9 [Cyprinus carpio]|uniref:Multiple epidermal growth factor-like domains protein 9 n=1 Tax=Cyprinus carpio TaxID=7962 RepID=A0A9Q9Y507_CYPCA|nr:multiple epidermal growth factor-like domains protein 9 [Cyprinus carpio]
MSCMRYTMLLFSVLELLLLLGYTAGMSRAVRRASDESASPSARVPRAVLAEPLEATTTIPNHLQEDDRDSRFSPFTPKMTITSRTTGTTNQLQPFWLTTTAAPLTKTMDPTSKRSKVKENSTFSTTQNNTENPTSSSPLSGTKNTTLPALDTANSSWTVKSTSKPLLVTTERGHQCNCSAEGSKDLDTCNSATGQCECLTGYTGQHCDECADAYFTNGTGGCQLVTVDSYGAVNQLCNRALLLCNLIFSKVTSVSDQIAPSQL